MASSLYRNQRVDRINGRVTQFSAKNSVFTGKIENAAEAIYLVIPGSSLLGNMPTLGSIDIESKMSILRLSVHTFIAEALAKVVRHRGSDAGKYFQDGNERFSVVLTYIPKEIYENRSDVQRTMSRQELLRPENIAALLITISIHDKELSFADAFSDQIEANQLGAVIKDRRPSSKPKAKGGRPKGRGRNQGSEGEGGSFGEGEGGDRTHSDSQPEELYNNPIVPPPAAAAAPEEASPRPDKPGLSLSKCGYQFIQTQAWKTSVTQVKLPLFAYTRINCLRQYALHVGLCTPTESRPLDDEFSSDSRRLTSPVFSAHDFHPLNAFSFGNAMKELGSLPGVSVDNALLDSRSWFNDNGEFSAPVVPVEGQFVPLPVCSRLNPLDFTVEGYLNNQLPHMEYVRRNEIRADFDSAKPKMTDLGGGRECALDELFAMAGVFSATEQAEFDREKDSHVDLIDRQFAKMFRANSHIESLRTTDPDKWREMKQQMSNQGKNWLEKFLYGYNFGALPRGIRTVVGYLKNEGVPAPVWNMVQTGDDALSPFCQYVVKDQMVDGTLLSATDGGVALVREIWIAGCSVGLPKIGVERNKLNLQIIGPAASSKSHTIEVGVSKLVPGCCNIIDGTSVMGSVRVEESERLMDVWNELPPYLIPQPGNKTGDHLRIASMVLSRHSEGTNNYRTMGKRVDENGQEVIRVIDTYADYTNALVGATNPTTHYLDPDGPDKALLTRFRILNVMNPVDVVRGKVIELISRSAICGITEAGQVARRVSRHVHALTMLYGTAMASYAVPLPDMRLYSDLFPIVGDFMAEIRPEVGTALRQLSRLKTTAMIECIVFACRMASMSPLASRFADLVERGVDLSKLTPDKLPANIPFIELMKEISLYCYMTYDIFLFVVSGGAHELLNGHSFSLLKSLGRIADYHPRGSILGDTNGSPWETDASLRGQELPEDLLHQETNEELDTRIKNMVVSKMTMPMFISTCVTGVYCLTVPMTKLQASAAAARKTNSSQFDGYKPYNLQAAVLQRDDDYDEAVPRRVDRRSIPTYKKELYNGHLLFNPNYVELSGAISHLAETMNPAAGNVYMSQSQIKSILSQLRGQTMCVRYMPCLPTALIDPRDTRPLIFGDALGMSMLQSLRYSKAAMSHFPVYKVPIVIEDGLGARCYVLVAALEMDIFTICRKMADRVCYSGSPERQVLFNMNSRTEFRHYQTYEMKRRPGVNLTITRRNGISSKDRTILADLKQYLTEDSEPRVYRADEDIEELYAMDYLRASNPAVNDASLRCYTPRGIASRLFGERGYYAKFGSELATEAYPDCVKADAGTKELQRQMQETGRRQEVLLPVVSSMSSRDGRDEPTSMIVKKKAPIKISIPDDDDDGDYAAPTEGFFSGIFKDAPAKRNPFELGQSPKRTKRVEAPIANSNSGFGLRARTDTNTSLLENFSL